MTEDNFYDDPDLAVPEGQFVKWDEPKTIVGTIKTRSKGTDLEGRTVANYAIELDDGDVVMIGGAPYQIKKEAAAERWNVGDRIAVDFKGKEKLDGGKTVNVFEIQTQKADEVAATKPKSLL